MKEKVRCSWPNNDPLMTKYHDTEWGVPVYDDRKLFEFLVLDAFQAGLSWSIVLKKRDNFRNAFDNFNPERIAQYNSKDVKRLLANEGIIRNRLKIEATSINAREFLKVKKEFRSFRRFIWQFTNYTTIQNKFRTLGELPAKTKESDAMSIDMKRRGFKFVGSMICYAFMQAAGMVNDHMVTCFRYKEIVQQQKKKKKESKL